MKSCELCKSPARLFCQSDQASLCWECDSRVHGANFLVARHLRTLLCRACQSPTPWSASGPKLNSTASVCSRCVGEEQKVEGVPRDGGRDEIVAEDELSLDGDELCEDSEDDDDEDVDVDEEESSDEDDEDNQVVPWSSPRRPTPTSSPESSISFSLKRARRTPSDLPFHDDQGW